MATLTVLVWIGALALSVFVAIQTCSHSSSDNDTSWTFFLVVMGLVLIGWITSEAINYDLYGQTVDVAEAPMRFYFLWGVVTLGTSSIAVFGQQIVSGNWRPWRDRYDRGKFVGGKAVSIGGVIGFIASVLGIISFYLDHVAKK